MGKLDICETIIKERNICNC